MVIEPVAMLRYLCLDVESKTSRVKVSTIATSRIKVLKNSLFAYVSHLY